MPFLVFAGALLLGMLLVVALVPFSLVQRYRVGSARKLARGWVATVNAAAFAVSVAVYVAAAAVTSFWVTNAFIYTLVGVIGGAVLGVLGLWSSRWEVAPRGLHYTPNRWLVLAITLVVTSRLLYSLWRGWHTWSTGQETSWLALAGVAGSMAAGGVVLGYYLVYWLGVWWRVKRYRRERRVSGSSGWVG
ncbi:MAG: hypothetical protein ABR606_18505 [Vicinamibacterales bacterium]